MDELISNPVTLSKSYVEQNGLKSNELYLTTYNLLSKEQKRKIFLLGKKEFFKKGTLKDKIEYLLLNKKQSARDAKKVGEATFKELSELVFNCKLDNGGNRDEELGDEDTTKQYIQKLSHNFRFVSGISEKSQLLATVIRESVDKSAHIRDNGTFLALAVGDYYDKEFINGKEWIKLCEDIKKEYIVDSKDSKFIDLVLTFFEHMSSQQLTLKYSLKSVINSNSEISELYWSTKFQYSLNLLTLHQHQKDMINANKQPNPWEAYNFYMTPHKYGESYRKLFLGDDVIKWAQNKKGLDIFTTGKILSSFQSKSKKKKVNRMIPLLFPYIISRTCDTPEQIMEAYQMIVSFSSYINDGINDYWTKKFEYVVENTTITEIKEFYEKEYLPVFQHTSWAEINTTVNKFKENNTLSKAWDAFRISKFDTSILLISIPIWFKHKGKAKTGLTRLVEKTVESYVKLLNGNTQKLESDGSIAKDENGYAINRSIKEIFSKGEDNVTNSNARERYVLKHIVPEVESWLASQKKDRVQSAKYKKISLGKHKIVISKVMKTWNTFYVYPLSSDRYSLMSFYGNDMTEWLHPGLLIDDEAQAVDGFLGHYDDNHSKFYKKKLWGGEDKQLEYWKLLSQRQTEMLQIEKNVTKKMMLMETIKILNHLIDNNFDLAV